METPAMMKEAEKVFAPVRELNKLALGNLEKLVELQLASIKSYTDLTLAQLQAAADAKDIEDVRALIARQQEIAQTVADKLAADTKNVMELGNNYVSQVQSIAKESAEQATVKVKVK